MCTTRSAFFKLSLSLFLFLFIISASAQKEFEDVILLKTAEVLRGNITDSIPGESVTILLHDSLSRTVMRADIVRILREPRRMTREQVEAQKVVKEKSRSESIYYQAIFGGGYGMVYNQEDLDYFKGNFVNGIGFNQQGSIGLGTGVRMVLEKDVTVVPVFFDVKFAFTRKPVSPLLSAGLGGTFQPNEDWTNTGTILFGELGVRFRGNNKSNVMITVGYESFEVLLPREGRFSPFSFYSARRPDGLIEAYTINFLFAF